MGGGVDQGSRIRGSKGSRGAESYQLSAAINDARSANNVRRTNIARSVNDARKGKKKSCIPQMNLLQITV